MTPVAANSDCEPSLAVGSLVVVGDPVTGMNLERTKRRFVDWYCAAASQQFRVEQSVDTSAPPSMAEIPGNHRCETCS